MTSGSNRLKTSSSTRVFRRLKLPNKCWKENHRMRAERSPKTVWNNEIRIEIVIRRLSSLTNNKKLGLRIHKAAIRRDWFWRSMLIRTSRLRSWLLRRTRYIFLEVRDSRLARLNNALSDPRRRQMLKPCRSLASDLRWYCHIKNRGERKRC